MSACISQAPGFLLFATLACVFFLPALPFILLSYIFDMAFYYFFGFLWVLFLSIFLCWVFFLFFLKSTEHCFSSLFRMRDPKVWSTILLHPRPWSIVAPR
jgi:hypothetical protein